MKKAFIYLFIDLIILVIAVCKVEAQSQTRTNIGLGTAATYNASSFLLASNNLSDVTPSIARTNLTPSSILNSGLCSHQNFINLNGWHKCASL
jgi:hypothetical protein